MRSYDDLSTSERICAHCGGTFTVSHLSKQRCCNPTCTEEYTRKLRAQNARKSALITGPEEERLEAIAEANRAKNYKQYNPFHLYLRDKNVSHSFECVCKPFIPDLVFHDAKVMLEFTGVDHTRNKTRQEDCARAQHFKECGFTTYFVPTPPRAVIEAKLIIPFLLQHGIDLDDVSQQRPVLDNWLDSLRDVKHSTRSSVWKGN